MSERTYWTRQPHTSRRAFLRGSAVAGAGLAGLALLGCGDDDDTPTPTATATTPRGTATGTPDATETPGTDSPRQGGTIIQWTGTAAAHFDTPGNAFEANTGSAQHVYDTLIISRSQDDRVYETLAAESLELVDETTLVVKLKEGLVFQDIAPVNGRPVITEDIAAMQAYVRDNETASDRTFQLGFIDWDGAGLETPDDQTLIYNFRRPSAYLFTGAQLGLPHSNCIAPREMLDNFRETPPIGSGPYQLASHQFDVSYQYVRNPTYRLADEGMPYIDNRNVIVLPDSSAQETAFRADQITVFTPPAEMADRFERDLGDRITAVEHMSPALFTWNMSRARETFDDIRVREAFYRMFNPDEYIDLVAKGWAVKAPGKLSEALENYRMDPSEVDEYTRHDPEEARQLLEAAGFDFNATYSLTTIISPNNEIGIQVFAEQLRRIGVTNTEFEVTPAGEWLERISPTGDYDFVGTVQHPGWDSPARHLRMNHTDPQQNHRWFGLRDPEIDEMIELSETLVDREENFAKVHEIQMLLTQRYAHLSNVCTFINREVRWNRLHDWETNPWAVVKHRNEAWVDDI